jgi:hypothetical protein
MDNVQKRNIRFKVVFTISQISIPTGGCYEDFWGIGASSLLKLNESVGGTFCFQLQGRKVSQSRNK